jgi:hypothetical protein
VYVRGSFTFYSLYLQRKSHWCQLDTWLWETKIPVVHSNGERDICTRHTPVFKKRPNFLNSSPTGTEDALRLLSAPSGRFLQQTVICPVSLWALVVELHPRNWARAQAVRRIIRRTVCARAQFSGCSSTSNVLSDTGQMTICCQSLPLGALSSRSASSVLVGELFKKFRFFNKRRFRKMW